MPRGRKKKVEEEPLLIKDVKPEVDSSQPRIQKNYYAFKYIKNKEGKYLGNYYCCNCKNTMTRLVNNWKRELDTDGFGPWEVKPTLLNKIEVPSYKDIKTKEYKP